jgi:hypothetical protein
MASRKKGTKTTRDREARIRKAAGENAAPAKVFDLGKRRARGTVDIPIYDPEDLTRLIDTGIRIRIASVWSKEAQDAAAAAAEGKDIRIEEANGVRRVIASEALIDLNVFEQTIGATVHWYHADLSKPKNDDGTWTPEEGFDGVLLIDGVKVPCTSAAVRELYTNPETRWMQKQVEPWYLNVSNFFSGPKSESPSPRASASA